MLVICSGLFLRCLGAAQSLDTGMDVRNVALVRFDPALGRYDNQSASRLIQDIVRDTEDTPGVRSGERGEHTAAQFGLGGNNTEVTAEGRNSKSERVRTGITAIAPRYFETPGIPVGRSRFPKRYARRCGDSWRREASNPRHRRQFEKQNDPGRGVGG